MLMFWAYILTWYLQALPLSPLSPPLNPNTPESVMEQKNPKPEHQSYIRVKINGLPLTSSGSNFSELSPLIYKMRIMTTS